MKYWIAVISLVVGTAFAESNWTRENGWGINHTQDPFTDEAEYAAFRGDADQALGIHCGDGVHSLMFTHGQFLGLDDFFKSTFRVDKGKVYENVRGFNLDHTGVAFTPRLLPEELLADMKAGSKLTVRSVGSSTSATTVYDLRGFTKYWDIAAELCAK